MCDVLYLFQLIQYRKYERTYIIISAAEAVDSMQRGIILPN